MWIKLLDKKIKYAKICWDMWGKISHYQKEKYRMNKYVPFVAEDIADSLITKTMIRSNASDRRGGNSKAYLIDDYCVLKTNNIELADHNKTDVPFNTVISKLHDLSESGVNVVPVLGYYYDQVNDYGDHSYGSGYIIEPLAKGSELYGDMFPKQYGEVTPSNLDYLKLRVDELAHAPQKQYDKFVKDMKSITDNKIAIDPSKKTNFFYDPQAGFSFVDLNFNTENTLFDEPDLYGNNTHRDFIKYCYLPCVDYLSENIISGLSEPELAKIKADNNTIFDKVYNGLLKVGVSHNDIQSAFEEQRNYISYSGKKECFGVDTDTYFAEKNTVSTNE